ncbi:FAD/NAD(P)-binding domain-containing protein [Setomelanomma holmii]|uniref:FAD/NAD(P)-binding domain-containing protein n=1 Tax=Setomelanomma holmii TaxID=210430 RepID=A0A9P4LLW0_9PLEO|nr:FAD/NAD(P)-binding domain-containing protein [Setomelanomma holmii]
MSFAARARRLCEDATITVFEKGPFVGYANCGIPYALGGLLDSDEALILQTPESITARYNVDVRLGNEVVNINREEKTVEFTTEDGDTQHTAYDKLVLAQGAEPKRPAIPGVEGDNVFTLQTIPDMEYIKCYLARHNSRSVAIIGGGFIGIEAAESFHASGVQVSIIEYMPHVFPPVDQDIAEPLHAEIKKHGVDLYLSARIKEIRHAHEPKSVSEIVLESGEKIKAYIILLVAGVRPRLDLAQQIGLDCNRFGVITNEHMQTTDPNIYAIGDLTCTTNLVIKNQQNLTLAGPANRQGRLVADHIFGKKVAYRGNVGPSVCQVFGLNVAIVGSSMRSLRAQGLTPEYITVHPPNHASYYPGSSPLTIKLAFFKPDGKILGAQTLGKEGVDKRIDFIATAMQAGMTVFDLEHLELAYAPPFGSVKDPVNMAGFVASNVLRGDTEIVHSEDLTPELLGYWQIVDVRSSDKFEHTGYVRGALLIPVEELREHLDLLDKNKKTLVYCQVGYRGYLAYRILKQNGFEHVVDLDGGFKEVNQGTHKALIA